MESVAMNLALCMHILCWVNGDQVTCFCSDTVCIYNNNYDLDYSLFLPWPVQSMLEVTHTYSLLHDVKSHVFSQGVIKSLMNSHG